MSDVAYVALGSNLGNRASILAAARNALSLVRGTRLIAVSRIEETAPFGTGPQGAYLNQMVALQTTLEPRALLAALHAIESVLGRTRRARWGARTIDLDLVRHGTRLVDAPTLRVPHPGLASRLFWRREVVELDLLLGRVA